MSTLRPVVYDSGALIAAERSRIRMWRAHRSYLTAGGVPVVPAPVVAQVWRGGGRQASLARMLHGCDVPAMDLAMAREIGELIGRAGSSDPVDGAVALLAGKLRATVVTSDPDDIQQLLDQMGEAGKYASVRVI
jgi:hypothetical protein